MALFRYHRGGLEESLKTTIIVKNKADLKAKISVAINEWFFLQNPNDFELKIEPYPSENNFDKRIGWFTQMVTVHAKNISCMPVGFLSEPIKYCEYDTCMFQDSEHYHEDKDTVTFRPPPIKRDPNDRNKFYKPEGNENELA